MADPWPHARHLIKIPSPLRPQLSLLSVSRFFHVCSDIRSGCCALFFARQKAWLRMVSTSIEIINRYPSGISRSIDATEARALGESVLVLLCTLALETFIGVLAYVLQSTEGDKGTANRQACYTAMHACEAILRDDNLDFALCYCVKKSFIQLIGLRA